METTEITTIVLAIQRNRARLEALVGSFKTLIDGRGVRLMNDLGEEFAIPRVTVNGAGVENIELSQVVFA